MQRSDRRTALWLALAVFAVLAPGAFFGVPGKSVAGAWRVLSGEVPYRDFWSMYAPGQFYATAAVLALCGKQATLNIVLPVVGAARTPDRFKVLDPFTYTAAPLTPL